MPNTISRRNLLRALLTALPLGLVGATLPCSAFAKTQGWQIGTGAEDARPHMRPLTLDPASLTTQLYELESAARGRLGLALVNSQGQALVSYRGDERFPLCSTSKIFMVAALLHQTKTHGALLQQSVPIRQQDIVSHSPIIEPQVGKSMTWDAICAATMQHSDNGAANLIMRQVGGPEGVTAFARLMGDTTFRLDRWEPELNTCLPDDVRDTSSPLAMSSSLHALALATQGTRRKAVFGPAQQQRLCTWLLGNTTGGQRIAAGVPAEWQVGDKTGSGDYGTTNDVAILWVPPSQEASPTASTGKGAKQPRPRTYTLSIYFTQQEAQAPVRSDIVAQAARLVCG